jgi:predicted small metal-binding protein
MRVIECDECGETLGAANDEELVRVLGAHLEREHGMDVAEDDLLELVEGEGYEAMDS